MKISKGRVRNINKKIIAGLLVFSIVSTPFVFNKINKIDNYIDLSNTGIVPKNKQKRIYKKFK